MKIDQTAIGYSGRYTWHGQGNVHFPTMQESKRVLPEYSNTIRMFFIGGPAYSNISNTQTIIALIESRSMEKDKFWFGGLRNNSSTPSPLGEGSGDGGILYSSTYNNYIYRYSDEWNAIPDNLNKNHKIPTDIEKRLDNLKAQRTKLESQL